MICTFKRSSDKLTIAREALVADNFVTRLRGLMFTKELSPMDALLIAPCNSIHTFFMNYPLDVVFLSRNLKVIKIIRNLKPWRVTRLYFGAYQVLEFSAGTLSSQLREGDMLEQLCIN